MKSLTLRRTPSTSKLRSASERACGGSGRTVSPRRMTRTGQTWSWLRKVGAWFSGVVFQWFGAARSGSSPSAAIVSAELAMDIPRSLGERQIAQERRRCKANQVGLTWSCPVGMLTADGRGDVAPGSQSDPRRAPSQFCFRSKRRRWQSSLISLLRYDCVEEVHPRPRRRKLHIEPAASRRSLAPALGPAWLVFGGSAQLLRRRKV